MYCAYSTVAMYSVTVQMHTESKAINSAAMPTTFFNDKQQSTNLRIHLPFSITWHPYIAAAICLALGPAVPCPYPINTTSVYLDGLSSL